MVDANAIILDWQYTPEDFFEESFVEEWPDCTIAFSPGRVTATMSPEHYDAEHKKRDELHEFVEGYFLARQVLAHRPYTLSKAGMSRTYPDGRRDVTAFPEPIICKATVYPVDTIITDKDGHIVSDTKRERIDTSRALMARVARLLPSDPLLKKLLVSFNTGITDPADELVHLLEIREALSEYFGSEVAAQHAIDISSTTWRKLGRHTNNPELKQSRHRGKHLGILRPATDDELQEVRRIARELIEAYVRYAENHAPAMS